MGAIARRVAEALRRMLGVPDYAGYLSHMRTCHPGMTPLDEADFARDALSRRYDRPGSRCC